MCGHGAEISCVIVSLGRLGLFPFMITRRLCRAGGTLGTGRLPGAQDVALGPNASAGSSQSHEWGTGWKSEPARTAAILSALALPGGVVVGPTCIRVLVPSVWLPHCCLHCVSHR